MLAEAALLPDLPSDLRKVAKNQLSKDGLLLHLLGALVKQKALTEKKLTQANFITDEGRLEAVKLQGKLGGITTAIATVFEMTEEEFKQDD